MNAWRLNRNNNKLRTTILTLVIWKRTTKKMTSFYTIKSIGSQIHKKWVSQKRSNLSTNISKWIKQTRVCSNRSMHWRSFFLLSMMVRCKLMDKSKETEEDCVYSYSSLLILRRRKKMSLTFRVDVHIQLLCIRKRYQWFLRDMVWRQR